MKVGDIAKGFKYDSEGIYAVWMDEMEEYVGRIGEIHDIEGDEMCIRFDEGAMYTYWWYPIQTDLTDELLVMLKKAHEELDCAEFCSYGGIPDLVEEMEVLIKKVEDGKRN